MSTGVQIPAPNKEMSVTTELSRSGEETRITGFWPPVQQKQKPSFREQPYLEGINRVTEEDTQCPP